MNREPQPENKIGYWMICGAHWTQRCECNNCCAYGCDCQPMRLSPANAAAFAHAARQEVGNG